MDFTLKLVHLIWHFSSFKHKGTESLYISHYTHYVSKLQKLVPIKSVSGNSYFGPRYGYYNFIFHFEFRSKVFSFLMILWILKNNQVSLNSTLFITK